MYNDGTMKHIFFKEIVMLKKILLVLVFVSMIAIVGCEKKPAAVPPVEPGVAEQAGQAADQEADAAKTEAGKELEKAGKELQK